MNVRETGLVEILCPHGVGHPSQLLTPNWQDTFDVHGCDGCCGEAAFRLAEEMHLERLR